MDRKKSKKTPWHSGEVYAYKLNSTLAEENGLKGRYLLLQKVGEEQWSSRVTAPIVYIKLTKDDTLPSNVEQYDELEYVQTGNTRYEERFFPYDFSRLEEDLEEKSKQTFEVDEYGYLPRFRTMIIPRAGIQIPEGLNYVGTFPDAKKPAIDYVPAFTFNLRKIFWKKDAAVFEMVLINAYIGFNLRTLEIYKKEKLPGNSNGGYSPTGEDVLLFGKPISDYKKIGQDS